MDFNQLPSFNEESWLYNHNSHLQQQQQLKSSFSNETLQEPVPFEGKEKKKKKKEIFILIIIIIYRLQV